MSATEMKTLLEDGNKAIAAIRAEVEALKGKSDPISAEKVAKMDADLATTLAAKSAMEAEMKAMEARLAEVETKANRPGANPSAAQVDEHKEAFLTFLRKSDDSKAIADLTAFSTKAAEFNSLTGTAGGLAIPKVVSDQIVKIAGLLSPFRGIARVVTVGTTEYSELLDLGGAGYEWVGETDPRNTTNTPNLGEAKPSWGMISAKPEATIEALQDSFFDAGAWVVESATSQFALGEGSAFISGNGNKKPMGLLAAPQSAADDATRAFGTLQTIATGDAAGLGANPFDALHDLVFGTKAQYRTNARWVLNSATLAALAKVKNANGDYILQPAVTAEAADKVLGYATTIAEDMPNIAADATPVAFGDFKRGYLIADRAGLTVQRDPYTRPGYIRFQIFRRVGGCVKDSHAVKLLKVSA